MYAFSFIRAHWHDAIYAGPDAALMSGGGAGFSGYQPSGFGEGGESERDRRLRLRKERLEQKRVQFLNGVSMSMVHFLLCAFVSSIQI